MTAREKLQRTLQQRIASYDDTMLAHLAMQMSAIEAEHEGLSDKLTDIVDALKTHNADEDPDDLQRTIDEAVNAVRYR
ncbi:MAG: hypothetical protein AAF708_07040 [Deinococcota bacterium]